MLIFGYLGEAGIMDRYLGFNIDMIGWLIVLYEVFFGEASKSAHQVHQNLQSAFSYLRLFALIGWSIYPIGFVMNDPAALNITYNIADAINKIGWGLIIYVLAARDSAKA